jgi:hypothetical protein
VIADGRGTPLALSLTSGDRYDVTHLLPGILHSQKCEGATLSPDGQPR